MKVRVCLNWKMTIRNRSNITFLYNAMPDMNHTTGFAPISIPEMNRILPVRVTQEN